MCSVSCEDSEQRHLPIQSQEPGGKSHLENISAFHPHEIPRILHVRPHGSQGNRQVGFLSLSSLLAESKRRDYEKFAMGLNYVEQSGITIHMSSMLLCGHSPFSVQLLLMPQSTVGTEGPSRAGGKAQSRESYAVFFYLQWEVCSPLYAVNRNFQLSKIFG